MKENGLWVLYPAESGSHLLVAHSDIFKQGNRKSARARVTKTINELNPTRNAKKEKEANHFLACRIDLWHRLLSNFSLLWRTISFKRDSPMVGILKRSRAFNWRAVHILEMVVMQMDGKLMSRIEGKISRSIVL